MDEFTDEEKLTTDEKLDRVIADMTLLKYGQEAIWTDIRADIEELKSLYLLGKKNWRQLLLGKVTEWVAAGLVSDVVCKQIEEICSPVVHQIVS